MRNRKAGEMKIVISITSEAAESGATSGTGVGELYISGIDKKPSSRQQHAYGCYAKPPEAESMAEKYSALLSL